MRCWTILVNETLTLRAVGSGREHLTCSPFAMRLLRASDWDGNVRQLFAVIERAAIEAQFH